MIYGRLTEAQQTQRDLTYGPGYPFIENGGKVYRITELVHTAVGHANYQAVEADPREVEQWLEMNKPKSPPLSPVYQPAPTSLPPELVLITPGPPPLDELVLPPPPPPDVQPHSEQNYPGPKPGFKPRLADFARTYGAYRGFGRIPNEIVEKYKSIYGDPPPLSQRAKDKKEELKARSKARTAARRAQMIPVDHNPNPRSKT